MSFLSYARALGFTDYRRVVSRQAHIHEDATLGVRTIVCAGAWIGANVTIGSDCYIGPNAVIGAPGFGYESLTEGRWTFREHPYGVQIRNRVSIGANSVIDRGRYRDTVVGQGTKIDAHCFIAHNAMIGEDCLIIANTMIAGSCEVGDQCWIGPSAQISDHIKVGDKARVGLGAIVLHDVVSQTVVVGNPARYLRDNRVTGHTAKVP